MHKTKSKTKNTGFYIALAICIVTIAAAAWTTYGSVVEYYQPQDVHTGNEVSGEPYSSEEPSEMPEPSEDESETPAEESVQESSMESTPQEESDVSEESSHIQMNSLPEESAAERMVCCPIENGMVLKPMSMTKLLFARTTNDWRVHRGTDYTAQPGTAVLAMTDGVVQSVYHDALYGEVICIDHEECTARYCGLTDKTLVREGDHVQAGQPIGYIGTIPCEQSDDSHLHLELLSGTKYLTLEQLTQK